MVKVAKTVTLDEEILEWINRKIEDHTFANLSHAIQKALYDLKARYEGEK